MKSAIFSTNVNHEDISVISTIHFTLAGIYVMENSAGDSLKQPVISLLRNNSPLYRRWK